MKLAAMKEMMNPQLLKAARHLQAKGRVEKGKNDYIYLNIDNAYINDLFPLLNEPSFQIPDYFSPDKVGAHISIIYPDEHKKLRTEDLGQECDFHITGLAQTTLGKKSYYVLLIQSSSLLQLRRKYALPDLLNFKGYKIDFHITVGTKLSDMPLSSK